MRRDKWLNGTEEDPLAKNRFRGLAATARASARPISSPLGGEGRPLRGPAPTAPKVPLSETQFQREGSKDSRVLYYYGGFVTHTPRLRPLDLDPGSLRRSFCSPSYGVISSRSVYGPAVFDLPKCKPEVTNPFTHPPLIPSLPSRSLSLFWCLDPP